MVYDQVETWLPCRVSCFGDMVPAPTPQAQPGNQIMSISDFEFAPEEMREFVEAAEELYKRKPLKNAKRVPKHSDLVSLKLAVRHTQSPEAIAVIAGITARELQDIIK